MNAPTEDHGDAEVVAQVVHEAVRAFRRALGEDDLPPWDEAPAWMRESSINAVRERMAHPDAPPSQQHEAWCREKRGAGWRYGAARDDDAKIHSMLVPYEQLPESERRKDALIQGIVDAFRRPL